MATCKIDLLEVKLTKEDKEVILLFQGQIRHYLPDTYDVLITRVRHKKGITPPYHQGERASLSELMNGLYRFKESFDNGARPRLEVKITKVHEDIKNGK